MAQLTIQEVLNNCAHLKIFEDRNKSAQYAEFVIFTKEASEWENAMSNVLGAPVKPTGARPSKDDLNVTKVYGGIRENQTLFRKDIGDKLMIVMYWPWSDKVYTTVKIAILDK